MKLREWLRESFTDAKGRPEPKMITGVFLILAAVAYAIYAAVIKEKPDWTGFSALAGFGVTLMTASAVADGFNDRFGGPPNPPQGA